MTWRDLRTRRLLWDSIPETRVYDAVALALCAIALARAAWLTSGLSWPHGTDQLRDIAFAEAFARGAWLSDAFFLNEWLWYPPLVPWLVGAAAVASGIPASLADVQIGPYINILSPLAFYALAASWFGRRAGLASLVVYLFSDRGPYWLEPTYSPWLLAGPASQAVFFGGLLALTRAITMPTTRNWAVVGLAIGVAGLGHSAPAVLLGGLAAVAAAAEAAVGRRPFRAAASLLLAAAVAAAVCGPLLISIVGHYGLRIRNPAGLLWTEPAVEVSAWALLTASWWTIPIAVMALLGAAARPVGRAGDNRGKWLLASWLALSLALFAAHRFEVESLRAGRPSGLPLFAPSHHFLFYFRAGLLVICGAGLASLASLLSRLSRLVVGRGEHRSAGSAAAFAVLMSAVLITSGTEWTSRSDFTVMADEARRVFAPSDWRALLEWMRHRTSPDDVFIAANSPALSIVGATGRKVVALDRFFANPYVDVQARIVTRQMYWDALAGGDCGVADRLARRYDATYVIHARSPEIPPGSCGLETVFEIPGVRVDRIRD